MALVGRKEITRQITDIRENLLGGYPCLNQGVLLSGLPLIGKTALVAETAKFNVNYGIPTTSIDFGVKEQKTHYAGEEGKTLLAADVMHGLVISADAPAGKPIYDNPGKWNPNVAADTLIEYMGCFKKNRHCSTKSTNRGRKRVSRG